MRIQARTGSSQGSCPGCGVASRQVHSRYERRLADTALAGQEVLIHLQVVRFVCRNAECGKKTFVEQVPGLTERYGRQAMYVISAYHVHERSSPRADRANRLRRDCATRARYPVHRPEAANRARPTARARRHRAVARVSVAGARKVTALTTLHRLLSRRDIPLREKTLSYESAARAAEILALNVEDLDLEGRPAPVASKGGAIEWVYWDTGTVRLLRLPDGSSRTRGPLFLTERRDRGDLASIAVAGRADTQRLATGTTSPVPSR
ncbi:transposase family protein [Nonomuraea sp. NPDC000554]|uniref:transposase family protein n=1 Tax=Nonomuraea sp. NPDC000554 TaxID=3154259 RepID=UPI00331DBED4